MKCGDTVRHEQRGEGVIKTICRHPITTKATKVIVQFRHGAEPRELVCWADDLRIVRRAIALPYVPRAAVRVIGGVAA